MLYFIYIMKTIKVKNKISKKIYYFRFFSDIYPERFWFTPFMEPYGFLLGYMDSFEPIKTTWKEIKRHEKRVD